MWLLSQRGLRAANQIDKSTIFLRATARFPHDNIYTRNINLQKRLESRKFNEQNFWTTRKSYKFQEQIAFLFVLDKNEGKALISVEDLRQSKKQCRHTKR